MTTFSTLLPTPKKRKRVYIIDRRFQLKYTGLLVAVVLAVMLVLGFVIGREANTASSYAQMAADQAEFATKESRSNNELTRLNVMMIAPTSPELVKAMEDELAQADAKAEKALQEVQQHRHDIEAQRRRLLTLLVGAGAALALLLGFMGIYITRRVVGPVYKIKRLLRRVGTGRLIIRDRLRRGDELEDLFDTFMQMTYSLKALESGRLATLDATLRRAETSDVGDEILQGLRALRAQMCIGLDINDPARKSVPPGASVPAVPTVPAP